MPRTYRYRQCPHCRAVRRAGQFPPTELGSGNWRPGGRWGRECPECGYEGQTRDFAQVDPEDVIGPPDVSIEEQLRRIVGRR